MQSAPESPIQWPRVSFIIPTLNAEALLDNSLSSMTRQTYPRDRYEIILADAHSKDRTREIARKYGATVLDDDGKNMEEGKRLALRHATGEYVVFVDADNELTHPDYIERAVKALAANPKALGVEGYYPPSPRMSSFCAYLTYLLHISDPISWLMSRNPELVSLDGEVERWKLRSDSFSYPLGANGFVFRRADLESVRANEQFQDTHAALHLMRSGKREWLRIRGRGVHHYYVQTLWGFVQKRRRATVHFLRVQEEMPSNWMREKPPIPLWLAALYCVTFIGPLWHTMLGLIRDGDFRWLWHLPACLASVVGDTWGVLTYKQRGRDKRLIADLQVKQTIRPESSVAQKQSPLAGAASTSGRKRIFLVANGMFSEQLAGGDIHFLHAIKAFAAAGWQVEYFGGRRLERALKEWNLPANVTFTENPNQHPQRNDSIGDQIHLFWRFFRNFCSTLRKLKLVDEDDVIYSPTDYWFDVLPVAFSKARRKVIVLQMQAPSLREIIFRSRPDVEASRVASLHYCISQWLSLFALKRCRNKRVVVVQSLLQSSLLKGGFRPQEVGLLPNGVDVETAEQAPEQKKIYDVAWIGRVHRQKGIDDLLATLQYLAREIPDYRAILIGNLKDALATQIAEMGLTRHVEFSGFVSGQEKYRLLKSARVYLMPSRHEGLPIVVGEALACDLPVVAYELEMYRPFFGNLLFYVPTFDVERFAQVTAEKVKRARAGERLIDELELTRFKKTNAWPEIGRQLVALLEER